MKACFAIALVACGHAAPAPAPIANRAPPEIDAGAPDVADAADEECTKGEAITAHVAGRDETVRIDTCLGSEEHHHGGDWISQDATASLVLDRDGGPVTIELADWETNMEDTVDVTLIGALRSASGDEAVLVEKDSIGPGDGLSGSGATLVVYAVSGEAWASVHQVDASEIDASISADGRVATVEICNDAGPGAGSGGGACHGEGDGKTIELRWDGEHVSETDAP